MGKRDWLHQTAGWPKVGPEGEQRELLGDIGHAGESFYVPEDGDSVEELATAFPAGSVFRDGEAGDGRALPVGNDQR